jgi:hypothetical protein
VQCPVSDPVCRRLFRPFLGTPVFLMTFAIIALLLSFCY